MAASMASPGMVAMHPPAGCLASGLHARVPTCAASSICTSTSFWLSAMVTPVVWGTTGASQLPTWLERGRRRLQLGALQAGAGAACTPWHKWPGPGLALESRQLRVSILRFDDSKAQSCAPTMVRCLALPGQGLVLVFW